MVTVVNRLLNRQADKDYVNNNLKKLNTFSDLKSRDYWAYYQIIEAANDHTAVMDNDEIWK